MPALLLAHPILISSERRATNSAECFWPFAYELPMCAADILARVSTEALRPTLYRFPVMAAASLARTSGLFGLDTPLRDVDILARVSGVCFAPRLFVLPTANLLPIMRTEDLARSSGDFTRPLFPRPLVLPRLRSLRFALNSGVRFTPNGERALGNTLYSGRSPSIAICSYITKSDGSHMINTRNTNTPSVYFDHAD